MDSPHADGDTPTTIVVEVTVVRTGGFAGLTREWHAEAEGDDAVRLVELIEGCPWDAVETHRSARQPGADRFVWRIDARCGPEERGAVLPDNAVEGPWRELVDTVRDVGMPPVS